jgi:hypothetical protein
LEEALWPHHGEMFLLHEWQAHMRAVLAKESSCFIKFFPYFLKNTFFSQA